jgi:HPt (histidine-containing phosphotransfer) domain-containing protein
MADHRNTSSTDTPTADTTSEPGAPGAAVLAAASLADLRALDPGGQARLVHRVLQTYQNSLGRLVEQLGTARAAGAWDQAARVAHTLKSSSASIGALELSGLCADIERHVREGDTAQAARCLARFDAEVVRVGHAVATALRAEEAGAS